MYKLFAIALALMMPLALTSCGNPQASAENSTPVSSSAESSENDSSDSSAEGSEDTSSVEEDRPVSPDVSKEEIPDPDLDDPIAVNLIQAEGENQADDGTLILQWSYQEPQVNIPSNREAEKLIQADLDLLISDFEDFITTQTQEAAESYESGEQTFEDSHYYNELNITVARCDDQVISLVIDDTGFSGGAHGWDNRYARNYDAMTGERITFDNLGGDSFVDFCRENLLNQIDAKIQQSGESNPFFSDYQDSIDSIIQDGTAQNEYGPIEASFYFNDQGLVFISGEYVLQPYAAGILEFSIPYTDLVGIMGDGYLLTSAN